MKTPRVPPGRGCADDVAEAFLSEAELLVVGDGGDTDRCGAGAGPVFVDREQGFVHDMAHARVGAGEPGEDGDASREAGDECDDRLLGPPISMQRARRWRCRR